MDQEEKHLKTIGTILAVAGLLSQLALAACSINAVPATTLPSTNSTTMQATATAATTSTAAPVTGATTTPPGTPAATITTATTPTTAAIKTTATTSKPAPATTTVAPVTQETPQHALLVQYILALINKDRADFGLPPVALGTNRAAQVHADDMFAGFFLSHWGTDGLKPYMRFTQAGSVNYEAENSAYAGWTDPSDDPNRWAKIDARTELKQLEYAMMYDDASSNWGHKDNILNPWHKKVNIGVTWDDHRLAFVQQFEGDYLEFTQLPELNGKKLSFSGIATLGTINSVGIYFDQTPQPLTNQQLVDGPHSYSLGELVEFVYPPPPPGSFYPPETIPPNGVQASRWTVTSGAFNIQVDLALALKSGPGIYTVAIVTKVGRELLLLSNYSLFIK